MNKNKLKEMEVLREEYFLGTTLNEEVQDDGKKHFYLEGIYAQAELQNKNGRVYPLNILKDSVDTFNREWVKTGRALGELMHPEGLEVNLDRVCLRILDLHQDPTNPVNFLGKSRILDGTPKGDLVIGLLQGGTQLGVSTRGAGSVEPNGKVKELILMAIDLVLNPSAPDAFQKALREEQEYTKRFQHSAKTKFLKEYSDLTESTLASVKQANQVKNMKAFKEFLELI